MNAAICDAIAHRKVVEFTYDGGLRTVEPHTHGESTAGNEVLSGFQTGGASQSGQAVAWKLYSVEKIMRLRQTGATFATNRPGYNPNDQRMSNIHCTV